MGRSRSWDWAPLKLVGAQISRRRQLSGGKPRAVVRLKMSMHRRVEVPPWRSFPPVTESNRAVATRGGEQLEVKG